MKIGEAIISELIKDKDVVSASIVGSYSENKDIKKIGDIDVVVICKKLTKKVFLKILKRVKKKKFKINTLINSTFGPMKISNETSLPIHLMIYDLESHKNHVLKSPFTCFDWERSKIYRGKSLKDIFSVKQLHLSDFYEARRNSGEYMKDIKKNRISIRQYKFQDNKVIEKKKFIKINPRNRGEFVYHIINFLVINLYKYLHKKNTKVKGKQFDNLFLKITRNNQRLLKNFKLLRERKKNKDLVYDPSIVSLALSFIKNFNQYLEKVKNEYIELNFIRHAQTSMNKKKLFLGSRIDPKIKNIKRKKINNIKYNYIITSNLLRAKMTRNFFSAKKILNNELINEIDYGNADGLTIMETKKKYPHLFESWKNGIDVKFPQGENTHDVKKRAKKFLNFLNNFKSGSKILIISHSFFLRVLFSLILKMNLKTAYQINIDHLKIFQFLKKGKYYISNLNRAEYYKILSKNHD
ncbi:histidine phosphatase family protein [Pelagibacterales bacterium SAG-MED05]|nr:histidine phosphatase family protein [Pelagibacterales bacterium SAG-MED05]